MQDWRLSQSSVSLPPWNKTCRSGGILDNIWLLNQSPFKIKLKQKNPVFNFKIEIDDHTIWKISRIIFNSYLENDNLTRDNYGFCYGPFRQGQSPYFFEYPTINQIWDDMCIISLLTRNIRTYSIESTQYFIPKIAKNFPIRNFTY